MVGGGNVVCGAVGAGARVVAVVAWVVAGAVVGVVVVGALVVVVDRVVGGAVVVGAGRATKMVTVLSRLTLWPASGSWSEIWSVATGESRWVT